MKQISMVIPVFNEEKFIDRLLKSIQNVEYPKENLEVIVVNDGSTDHTALVVKQYPDVRLIELQENMGRYHARKTGAEAASYPNILFVDSRSEVDPNILLVLDRLDAKAINGYSVGNKTLSTFETFYHSIRRVIFSKFYKNYNQPIYLTSENFDSMPKGTTVFYADKKVLLDAYEDLAQIDMGKESSDDTKLLRTIVNRVPVLVHPDVKITNFARTSFWGSVKHLYMRGSKFVDYYLNPAQRNFWLVIILPLLAIFGIIVGLIFVPVSGIIKIAALIALDLLASLLLSRKLREFSIIIYMLPLCTVIFYSGIIRGIFLKSKKASKIISGITTVIRHGWGLITFQSSEKYWIKRYKRGENSGCGSYGQLAQYKADVINKFVETNGICTIIEYGCGDGNQLKLAKYLSYIGFDISPDAILLCKNLFKDDSTKTFKLMSEYRGEKAELTLSLDVIYHLVENDVFENHMRLLFNSADNYTIIYSTNADENVLKGPHIKHRHFTEWIKINMPSWKLISHIPGYSSNKKKMKALPDAEFFIYEKIS